MKYDFYKFHENRLIIDGENNEKHALLVECGPGYRSPQCIKASFYITENSPHFPYGFRMEISMKLVYQYMVIFFHFSTTANYLHPLQVENCDSNSRLVVDEDDHGKLRFKRIKDISNLPRAADISASRS